MYICKPVVVSTTVRNDDQGNFLVNACCAGNIPVEDREKIIKNGCPFKTTCQEEWQEIDITSNAIPNELMLCLTSRCNFDCIYCQTHQKKNRIMKEYTVDYLYNTITSRVDVSKIKILNLCSGEFFIDKTMRDLVKKLMNNFKSIQEIVLATNGYYWDEEILKEVGILDKIIYLHLSVYGDCNENYKRITTNVIDGFDKVIKQNYPKMLKYCKERFLTLNFRINTCSADKIYENNETYITRVIDYIRTINPKQRVEIFNIDANISDGQSGDRKIMKTPHALYKQLYYDRYKDDKYIILGEKC
jgi:uncharacterized Fe-S cluster-containing radical SAM superfamily protein